MVAVPAGLWQGGRSGTKGLAMIVAFEIGGSRIRAAAGGVALGEAATPASFDAFVAALAGFCGRVLPPIAGVAISIAGVVDRDTGRITVANIPCLDGRILAADLHAALGLPVLVLNDADCFALAEAQAGAGQGCRVVFGVILGTGVGGGLVIDGRVHQGAGGCAGEWGHGPVVQSPLLVCGCGQVGCLDTVGGARGMERLHLALTGEVLEVREIVAGRAATVEAWVQIVGGVLAMVVNVVGADVVPVGGGLSNDAGLIARLDAAVRARILRRTDRPLVVPAVCGADAGLIGAAAAGAAAFG